MYIPAKSILLDANLLLLYLVGQFDLSLVGTGRLDVYDEQDFERLASLLGDFPFRLTTPHLLTEVSNLADHCIPKWRHREFRTFFKAFVADFNEHWMRASTLTESEAFLIAGLADSAVAQLADDKTLVLSVDAELCGVIWGQGGNAENFNRSREL